MPLILDAREYSEATLDALVRSLVTDLAETRELVEHPRGPVRDAASLETARELLDAAIRRLRGAGPKDREALAADANLAYATLLAVIDLVKSHTDVPRVPARRPSN